MLYILYQHEEKARKTLEQFNPTIITMGVIIKENKLLNNSISKNYSF